MKELTITNFEQLLATLVSIVVSLGFFANRIKAWLDKYNLARDKEQTKDFLVIEFARAERHPLGAAECLRVKERYDHYIKKPEEGGLGGNSYIKEEYERLKEEKKL